MRPEIKERIAMIDRGEVPEGYKRTNTGIIPQEWTVEKIGAVANFFSGGTPATSVSEYYGGNIHWITSGDLNKSLVTNVSGRITDIGLKNSSAKMVDRGTLLIALYGATAGVTAIAGVRAAINQAVLAIVPKKDISSFLYYQLSYLKKWIINTYTQGGQPNLTAEIIKSVEITLSTPIEQTAIVSILSTWDRAIELKEKLLEQKKIQKKALMDELLTGKVRPLGFSEEWEQKRLKQILEEVERPIDMTDETSYEQVTIRRNYGGVDSRGRLLGKDILVKSQFVLKEDDFVISRRQIAHGACGVVPDYLDGAIVSNEYDVFKAKPGLNIHFFSYMMKLPIFKRLFYTLSNGVHIEKMIFHTNAWLKRKVSIPSLAEQEYIVSIISAIDREIEIEAKMIDQLKAQKKGLMQLLLTGKVRVPCAQREA